MAHVAQRYKKAPFYWEEGIADYVRYKLGYTNGWSCPQCAAEYPHYTSGYWCAGAFLLYVDGTCGSNVVRQLNAELRHESYSDKFFAKATGRSLDELWGDFQKTPAFTPAAAEQIKLNAALGRMKGKPPKNALARNAAYVQQQPGGALTMDAGKFLADLIKNHQAPGLGWAKGDHRMLTVSAVLPEEADPAAYPAVRTFYCFKADDFSLYHYRLVKATKESEWKLDKAWQTGPEGNTIKDYPVEKHSVPTNSFTQ
jgi:hypothetical protein